MMHFLLSRAVNPIISLIEGLKNWNQIASALRERTRKRKYQQDKIDEFLY
jgi:hypothetical protein